MTQPDELTPGRNMLPISNFLEAMRLLIDNEQEKYIIKTSNQSKSTRYGLRIRKSMRTRSGLSSQHSGINP